MSRKQQPHPMDQAIRESLQEALDKSVLTQKELAGKLDVTEGTISRYIGSKNTEPRRIPWPAVRGLIWVLLDPDDRCQFVRRFGHRWPEADIEAVIDDIRSGRPARLDTEAPVSERLADPGLRSFPPDPGLGATTALLMLLAKRGAELDQASARMQAAQDRHARDKRAFRDAYRADLEARQAQADQQLEALRGEIADWKASIGKVKEFHEKRVETLEECREDDRRRLREAHRQVDGFNELQQRQRGLQRTNDELRASLEEERGQRESLEQLLQNWVAAHQTEREAAQRHAWRIGQLEAEVMRLAGERARAEARAGAAERHRDRLERQLSDTVARHETKLQELERRDIRRTGQLDVYDARLQLQDQFLASHEAQLRALRARVEQPALPTAAPWTIDVPAQSQQVTPSRPDAARQIEATDARWSDSPPAFPR